MLRLELQHGEHLRRRFGLLGEHGLRRGAPGRVGGELLMRGPQQGGRAKAKDENGNGQRDSGEQETDAGEHFWVRFRLRGLCLRGPWSQNGNAVTTMEVDRPRSPPRIRLGSTIPQALFSVC